MNEPQPWYTSLFQYLFLVAIISYYGISTLYKLDDLNDKVDAMQSQAVGTQTP